MSLFNRFPNTDYNGLNLDWLLKTVKTLSNTFDATLEEVRQWVQDHLGDVVLSYFYRADDQTVILAEEYKDTGTVSGEVKQIQINDDIYTIPENTLQAFYKDSTVILSDSDEIGTDAGEVEYIQVGSDRYDIPIPSGVKKPLQDCKCLLIGNSWARGSGGVVGKGWPYYFQQYSGCDAYIIQQAGGDFCDVGNSNADYPGKTYVQLMTDVLPGIITDPENYQYIIVGGCLNDMAYGNNVVRNAISSFVTYAKNLFPNAQIWIVPLLPGVPADLTLMNTQDAWNAGAENVGVSTCVHTYGWFYGLPSLHYNNSTAEMHLNDDGYKLCGAYMAALVNGWDGQKNVRNHVGWSGNSDCTYSRVNYTRTGLFTYLNLQFTISGSNLASGIQIGAIDPQYVPAEPILIPAVRWTSSAGTRALDAVAVGSDGSLIYRTLGTDVDSSRTYTIYINSTFKIG